MKPPRIVQVHGGKVHRDTCPTIRGLTQTPLNPQDSGDLARQITYTGAQSCRRCKPITALAIYERQERARTAAGLHSPRSNLQNKQ